MIILLIITILLVLLIVGITIYLIHKKDNAKKDNTKKDISKYFFKGGDMNGVSPKNGKNESVDWFLIIKLPHQRLLQNGDCNSCGNVMDNCQAKNKNETLTGSCYFYADSENSTLTYYTDLGYSCLSSNQNPLYYTLNQLKDNNWGVWNDQGYDGTSKKTCSEPNAHSKGAVCYDENQGFVLNVSTPNWPNTSDFLQSIGCQPTNNAEFAQQFFCFSMNKSNIDKWANNVSNASLCVVDTSSNFQYNLKGTGQSIPNVDLETLNGNKIKMIVKGGGSNGDKFSPWSVVSAGLNGSNLSVASWTSANIGSKTGWYKNPEYDGCGNLTQILTLNTPKGSFKSVYSNSHAKFGISDDNLTTIFGSMNEQESQQERGGDFYAIKDKNLWNSLNSWVGNTQPI